jgi:hypothetical protein
MVSVGQGRRTGTSLQSALTARVRFGSEREADGYSNLSFGSPAKMVQHVIAKER